MSSLLEPLIMAILGVLVGGLVIAMYLPIFKLGAVGLTAFAELFQQTPAAWVAVVFLVSLLVGSFLNVVIHRVPVMLEREWRTQAEEILRRPAGCRR